jgi:hypothetical protein
MVASPGSWEAVVAVPTSAIGLLVETGVTGVVAMAGLTDFLARLDHSVCDEP